MLGSRVCWQLLLGWALLLGQPVFGDLDSAEEPLLAESEELVPVSPEEPVPESREQEESVPELQEPEDLESGDSLNRTGQSLSEEIEMLFNPSDEELETRAQESRQRLERDRDFPLSNWIRFLKHISLDHYNQKSKYVYKLYENGNQKIKKAIGTMIYIKLLLVKTSCTKEEGEALMKEIMDDYDGMAQDSLPTERKQCLVPPASEQEIVECTFTLFKDARSDNWHKNSVTDSKCVPFGGHHENDY